jgi:hypothetical protein
VSVVDGIGQNLVSQGIWEAAKYGLSYVRRWRYVRLFGSDVIREGGQHITVGALRPPMGVDGRGNPVPFVFTKPGVPGHVFSTSVAVGQCELRSASYLAESIALNGHTWASVLTDEEIEQKFDLSFVSIGLMNNLKTIQMMRSPANTLVVFDVNQFRK